MNISRRSFIKSIGIALGAMVIPLPKINKGSLFKEEWIKYGNPPTKATLYEYWDEYVNGDTYKIEIAEYKGRYYILSSQLTPYKTIPFTILQNRGRW